MRLTPMKAASALCLGFCATFAAVLATAAPPQESRDRISTSAGELTIIPINHATLALRYDGQTVLVDPVGDRSRYAGLEKPQLILITDIHGDHFNKEVLTSLCGEETKIVAPPAVAEQLPEQLRKRTTVLSSGQHAVAGLAIDAVAAYNLNPDRQKFHSKGRGNGYVLTIGGKRIYISGDTEDTPEMRSLKDIDIAFLCMNLPYTMDVEQAARAVRVFRPKVVYPYHYRGSDLKKFKELVGTDTGIEVRLRDWYAGARM